MTDNTENEEPCIDEARARMSPGDAAEWEEIQGWKEEQMSPKNPRVISRRIRSFVLTPVRKLVAFARKVPGCGAIMSWVSGKTLALIDKATSVSETSVGRCQILKAYRKAGYNVETIEDIRTLSLEEVRAVKPHLRGLYACAAGAEGAVSGVIASGGAVAAILGLGIASAPGIALTTSAIALDITMFLGGATRLVSHMAAYYGYDTTDPAENLFATMVLSQAIDPTSTGEEATVEKETTMRTLNKVMSGITKRGPMNGVSNNVITATINSLFASLGVRLAGMKLAQIVPLVGVVVGVYLNASLMRTIGDTAEHLYRERFLAERYGYIDEAGEDSSGTVSNAVADEISADIAYYVELAKKESPQL